MSQEEDRYSLKEAYQYMESKVVKGTGNGSTVIGLKHLWTKGNNLQMVEEID